MASYSTIPAAEEPLVAKPQGKSLKALVAGAAVASFALGAVAATAVSASVAAPTTAFFKPMYVFNKSLGTTTFEECKDECPKLSGKSFKAGQMSIPCITSFDMNHQLLAWMTEKYGPVDTFAWIGHKTIDGEGEWVPPGCQAFQDKQYKGDFIYRNGCAFSGDTKKTECTGSDFDDAPGCAVLVYAGAGPTGAAALNVKGEVTSYEMLHGNWIKSADCKFAEVPGFGARKTVECICQKTQD